MSAPAVDAPDSLSHLIPSRTIRGFVVAVVSGVVLYAPFMRRLPFGTLRL